MTNEPFESNLQSWSIFIDAPKQKVWDVMLDKETYAIWTSHFYEGSHYTGTWKLGETIKFIAPNKDGSPPNGMISRVKTFSPPDGTLLEHDGVIKNGVEDTTSDECGMQSANFEMVLK